MSRENIEIILEYAKKTFHTEPDHPWKKSPENMVLRHEDSQKWYGLIFTATRRQLGLSGSDELVDILNVKIDPMLSQSLRSQPGILPGYHMNHVEWTTLLLDGTVPMDTILDLLAMSYQATAKKKKVRDE